MYKVKRFSQLYLSQEEFARKDYLNLTVDEAEQLRARRNELAQLAIEKRAAAKKAAESKSRGLFGSKSKADKHLKKLYEDILSSSSANAGHARSAVLNGRPRSVSGGPVNIDALPNATRFDVSNAGTGSKEPGKISKALEYAKNALGKNAWKHGTAGQRAIQAAVVGGLGYGGYKGFKNITSDEGWEELNREYDD